MSVKRNYSTFCAKRGREKGMFFVGLIWAFEKQWFFIAQLVEQLKRLNRLSRDNNGREFASFKELKFQFLTCTVFKGRTNDDPNEFF